MLKAEAVSQFLSFAVENTTNKQANAQDVLMDISSKVESVFTQLWDLISLVKDTPWVDFVKNVHLDITFTIMSVHKLIISAQSSIIQDQYVRNVTTRPLKELDVCELVIY